MSLGTYSLAEADTDTAKAVGKAIAIGKLATHERCVLMRRRAGYTQKRVAEELGVCRFWLNQMESGKVDVTPLTSYWEA